MPEQTDMRQRRYVAYLLRLWLSDNAGQPAWRGSLEDPRSGSRIGFGDVQSLFAYLNQQTEIPPSASGDPEAEGVSKTFEVADNLEGLEVAQSLRRLAGNITTH